MLAVLLAASQVTMPFTASATFLNGKSVLPSIIIAGTSVLSSELFTITLTVLYPLYLLVLSAATTTVIKRNRIITKGIVLFIKKPPYGLSW